MKQFVIIRYELLWLIIKSKERKRMGLLNVNLFYYLLLLFGTSLYLT